MQDEIQTMLPNPPHCSRFTPERTELRGPRTAQGLPLEEARRGAMGPEDTADTDEARLAIGQPENASRRTSSSAWGRVSPDLRPGEPH